MAVHKARQHGAVFPVYECAASGGRLVASLYADDSVFFYHHCGLLYGWLARAIYEAAAMNGEVLC